MSSLITQRKNLSNSCSCFSPDLTAVSNQQQISNNGKLINNNENSYKSYNYTTTKEYFNRNNVEKVFNFPTGNVKQFYGDTYRYNHAVPINKMPPPPHPLTRIVVNDNNNIIVTSCSRRRSWKYERNVSPNGSETSLSVKSNASRTQSVSGNVGLNDDTNNSVDMGFEQVDVEHPLINNKFSNSAPSVFYSSPSNNHHHWNGKYRFRAESREKRASQEIERRVFGLMERFSSKSSIFAVAPGKLVTNGSIYDSLSQSVWDVFQAKAQTEMTYLRKLDLWKTVYLQLGKMLARFGIFLVGSTMSGLGTESSDIDMCLLVRPCINDARLDALSYLQAINTELQNSSFVKWSEVIQAKVPILKFRDAHYGFEVDLNCNNAVGIRNTHLLNCYARLDWRVRPLVVVTKLWAQDNNINDAKSMTISSYSLALMVIHYLQCGVTPPAIPCLHGLYPHKFSNAVEIHDIDIQEALPPFRSDNAESLAELFLGFLHYYSYFDYERYAISVREGTYLPKEECRFARSLKNDIGQWKLLCIEEPFDLTNTARSVYDPDIFKRIKDVFLNSYTVLNKSKNLYSVFASSR